MTTEKIQKAAKEKPFKKGDEVVYRTFGGQGGAVKSVVRTAHKNGTYTIEAMFALNDSGTEIPGYLGFKQRIKHDRLTFFKASNQPQPSAWNSGGNMKSAHRKSDFEIIAEVNQAARILAGYIGTGYTAPQDHKFYEAKDSRSRKAWAGAVEIYEFLTNTEVHDALLGLNPEEPSE